MYNTELDTLRGSLNGCPSEFLSCLKAEIEVILTERDEYYQRWLLRQSAPRLRVVDKRED